MGWTWSKEKGNGYASWDSGLNYKSFIYSIVVVGTNASNTIKGSAFNDTLYGRSGHDKMYGYNGNDKIKGDAGNDIIKGGYGHDYLYGGYGNDQLIYNINDNDVNYTEEIFGQTANYWNATEAYSDIGTDTLSLLGVETAGTVDSSIYLALIDLMIHINGINKNTVYDDLSIDTTNQINLKVQGVDTLKLDNTDLEVFFNGINGLTYDNVPQLDYHSGAINVLYIDFDGANQDGNTLTGTFWNSSH